MDRKRLPLLVLFFTTCYAYSDYIPWNPSWMPRDDLQCMFLCKEQNDEIGFTTSHTDKCCTCLSRSSWIDDSVPLYIEPVSILGETIVVSLMPINISSNYKIVFKNQKLKSLPRNLCNLSIREENERFTDGHVVVKSVWDRIVFIDFSHNQIASINDVNCLLRLDTLDLSFNLITHLSNTSFQKLTYLRVLKLNNNNIRSIDSTVISAPSLHLQIVDISYNKLTCIDVTNFFSLYPFCTIDYSSCKITKLINPSGFKLDTSRNYGPGDVRFRSNNITKFPDFKELLNLDSLAQIGKLFNFKLDLLDIPIRCDCNLEPFMSQSSELISIWNDISSVKCSEPPSLKGVSITQFTEKTSRQKLICDLSNTRECSRYKCSCINQPSSNTLFVNCSGRNLTEMPDPLPSTKFSSSVNLDLSNNNIKELANTSYLQRVSHLSLADNDLMVIRGEAALMLENSTVIDLSNNKNLRVIPPVIQYRPNGSIILNNLIVNCDCGSEWIQNSNFLDDNNFTCRVPNHGNMAAKHFNKNMLDCDNRKYSLIVLSIILGLSITLLMVAGGLCYWLRYEILITLIRFRKSSSNTVSPVLFYDAFLSFDDDDDDLRNWINKILVPYLQEAGYNIFVPFRDLTYGDSRERNTLNAFNESRNLLIVLSENHTFKEQKSWLEHEWKYGWSMFKKEKNKNIVMINFDQILTSEINHSQIRAFLRVGGPIDFSNTRRNILEQICQKLGPPISKLKCSFKPVVGKNVFSAWQLFVAKDSDVKYDNVLERKQSEIIRLYHKDGQFVNPNYTKTKESFGSASGIDFSQPSSLPPFHETISEQLVTEKERPAFGKYGYYV